MMSDCIFCKMVRREIVPAVVYEDADVLAFNDINPQAPVHILVIPKQHIATLNELTEKSIAGELLTRCASIAKEQGLAEDGYRTVINCNGQGGQEVYHLHIHLLGGRQMLWPPG